MTRGFDPRERTRWSGSLLLVLGIHAMVVATALFQHADGASPATAPMEAVMLELAPEPESPPQPPQEVPPGPQQVQQPPQPEPEPRPEPPDVEPDVVDPYQAEPREQVREEIERSTAPPPAEKLASTAAAAENVRASGNDAAPATWESRLLAHLETHQRYPHRARSNRQQGVAYLRVSIGAGGELLAHSIERGSGYAVLDQEALAALLRARPLPPPPPEIGRFPVERIVPMQFIYRGR